MLDDRVDPSEHSDPAVWVNKVYFVETDLSTVLPGVTMPGTLEKTEIKYK